MSKKKKKKKKKALSKANYNLKIQMTYKKYFSQLTVENKVLIIKIKLKLKIVNTD